MEIKSNSDTISDHKKKIINVKTSEITKLENLKLRLDAIKQEKASSVAKSDFLTSKLKSILYPLSTLESKLLDIGIFRSKSEDLTNTEKILLYAEEIEQFVETLFHLKIIPEAPVTDTRVNKTVLKIGDDMERSFQTEEDKPLSVERLREIAKEILSKRK